MTDNRKYKSKNQQQLMDAGLLPPQCIDLEESVLGAMMLESECVPVIIDILKIESFYKDCNSRIFSAITSLFKQSYPIDIKTVVEQLKKSGELDLVGGAYYVVCLTNGIASSAHTEFHARIIQQKFMQRELIKIGTQTANTAYQDDADIFDLIDELEKKMTALTANLRSNKSKSMPTLWNELAEKNDLLFNSTGLNGIPSGFNDMDKTTAGFQAGNSIILAARPAMGKTALAINIACNAAIMFNKPTLIFSLEMSALELFTRMVSSESLTSNNRLNRKGVDPEQLFDIQNKCIKLINSELYIDSPSGMTLTELRSKARKYKREKNIEFIVIDYLQLMSGGTGDRKHREQEISEISRGIKMLAKELELPILTLSQLARETEKRGGEMRPRLSDLRESGAIEQDADVVMFLHRPEYYNITEDENGKSTKGVAEIIYGKNRNGPAGCSDYLGFIDYLTKFTNIDYDELAITQKQVVSSKQKWAPNPNKFTEPVKDEDHPF